MNAEEFANLALKESGAAHTLVKEAKRLRRKNPVSGKRKSLKRVSKELFEMGYHTSTGKPFSATQIKRMVGY